MTGPATAENNATAHVLSAMLTETVELMNDVSAIGDYRAASGEAGPHETATYLRLSSRLARIGGWILAQEAGDETDRSRAAVELENARRGALDGGADVGPLAETALRVERLAERASRLERLLRQPPEASAPRPELIAAAVCESRVLSFVAPSSRAD